jgi:trimeric autotransporter adhesin
MKSTRSERLCTGVLAACLFGFAFCSFALAQTQPEFMSGVPARITQVLRDSPLQTLRGNTHPLALPQYDIGRAPGSMAANRMILVLQRSAQQEASLRTWLDSVQNVSSSNFRRWMTPEEFGARFGVSDADLATVESWLQSQGFSINKVAKSRMAIEFSGTTAQVEAAFHTSIHSYVVQGVKHWANASDPQIPSALAPVVAGLAQLNNFEPRSNAIRGPAGEYDAKTGAIHPSYTIGSATQGYYIFVAPADAATIYNIPTTLNPNLSGTAYDGSGVTIGIAGDSNIDVAQNAKYRSTFGLPAKATSVVIDGGNDPGENGDAIEAYLDTEVAGGMAPNANITLYTAEDTAYQSGLFLAVQRALDDNQIDILNVSFGACEAVLGVAGNQFINNLWEQAASQGITVTVSSGDSGSAGCDNPNTELQATNGLAVNGIGSTPFNISVGGTDFDVLYSSFPGSFSTYVDLTNSLPNHRSALKYIPEEPWNNSTYPNINIASNNTTSPNMNIVAGGGGVSSVYALPNWQSSASSSSGRGLPDVSFLAGNGFYGAVWGLCTDLEVDNSGNPVADCTAGATGNNFYLTGVGGTSAAAPAFAGMLALVKQKTGTRLGQADYVIYNLAKTAYSSVFHDVTTGDNSVFCTLNSPNCQIINASIYEYYLSGYNAGTGYDLASGLGSVNAGKLVSSWSGASLSTTTSTLQLNGSNAPLTITHGQSVAVNGSVTSSGGTPAGSIGLVDNLSPATSPNAAGIATFALSNGAATGSTTAFPGGSYQVSAHYSGSNTFAESDSNAISVTVSPETSSTTLKVAGVYDPSTGKASSTSYYGFIYLLDAQPYGNSASANNPNGAATGTVTFKAGTTSLGTAGLSSEGVAELQTSVIPGGSNNLTAAFPGDASFQASFSAAVPLSITPAITTLNTPAFTPFDPYFGANETLSVTVKTNSAGAGPTGTVTFMNGSNTLGTANMVGTAATSSGPATGTATLTVNTLPSGSNTITAVYNGDSNYAGSTSPSVDVTILANPTTLSFSPASSTVIVNQPLQFTVTPSAVSGIPLPTGTVQVYYNQSGGGVAATLVNGVASITIPANTLSLGTYGLSVIYSGDKAYQGSTTAYNITVKSSGTVAPIVTISAPGPITTFPVTITVSITGPGGNPVPTGSVTLTNPNFYVSTQTLNNGATSFVLYGGLAYGPNTLTASYLGDTTYTAGTATTNVTLPAPGVMYFDPSSATIAVSQAYSVKISVLTQPPFPPATGNITLSSGSYSSAATPLTSGAATITIPANSLALGTDTLAVIYSGDGNYLAGANSQTITVNSVPPGLTLSGSNITVAAGGTTGNTAAISVTPSGGFTGSVVLTAAITTSPTGAQHLPTLSFGSTSPVSITDTTAETATLTVSTTAPTTAALPKPTSSGGYGGAATFLALIVLCGIPAQRKRWRRYFALTFLAVLAYGAFGCGGSSSSRTTGGGGSPGTTPGTYTVTITATSGSINATTTLNVVVQ